MGHVQQYVRVGLPALQPVLQGAEATLGFVPNSLLTMAHMPQLAVAFGWLANVVFGGDLRAPLQALKDSMPAPGEAQGNLPPGLVQLTAFAASLAAGCRYCQAHTSHGAQRAGESQAKFDAILDYEASPLFSEPERAALALAFAAGVAPNEAERSHFARLRKHFDERQIVQITAVIALFGFLNRWNDTMATRLEEAPAAFAATALNGLGWQAGKHAS